ncbi:MAG: hypothetical protein WBP82_03870 [Leuconostoc mesenteroides]
MGVALHKPDLINKLETINMNVDVRSKTEVYIVCRRAVNGEYHFQGVAAAIGEKSAEQVAIKMCRDENYYIFPALVNVSLPHKLVIVSGLYFPLKESEDE